MNPCRLPRAILLLLLPLLAGTAVAAEPAPEYQLKSAFLYHFATFIAWPQNLGQSLTLCVAAPHDAIKYFLPLQGKPVGAMKVAVRNLAAGESAAGCRILFVTDAESGDFDDWLSEVGDQQVLTVAESQRWLKKGVVMDLMLEDQRVVFDVNMEAAQAEGLEINSKLLRLARNVYGLESADEAEHNAD